jgi:AraC-like DNA-binding protein
MMSSMRQPGEPDVRAYAVTHPGGTVVLPQPPGWDQLVYAAAGVMTVATPMGTWVVPPHRAVWVPSGLDHRIELNGRTSLRTLYLATVWRALPPVCTAVNVPPLVRELILHIGREAPLYRARPQHERLIGVLCDQLQVLPAAPLQLPVPADGRARAVAEAILADPASGEPVAALAARFGVGRRTLERCFAADTGMSVGRWRTRARLVVAIRMLAEGHSATAVAAGLGYATPSSFGAAFKRELGTSPARYLSPHPSASPTDAGP